MDKLLDAYDFINHYKKRNKPVPQDVLDEAREAEIEWLRKELASAFQEHIQPILDKFQSKLTLVCEHTPNESTGIFLSRETDIISLLDDAVSHTNFKQDDRTVDVASEPETMDEDVVVEEDEADDHETDEHRAGKSKSIGFSVRFVDGKVISRSSAKDTMIDAFLHMGLDKVATFKERTFKGFHLVDRRKRTDKGGLRTFPDRLQGSYGVIKTLDELEDRRRRGQQVDNRYFLDPHDILTSSDGVEYTVCNQWGDQFSQFQQHVKNFGWTLTEV